MAVNMGSAIAYLDMDTSGFTGGFSKALSSLKVFNNKSATTTQKLRGLSTASTAVGRSLTLGLTVPLAGVAAASVKVASDFEAQMSKVQAISGATGKDFERLNKTAIELGSKTKYSASQVSEAMQYMAMAGWKVVDMIGDGTKGNKGGLAATLNLAAASGEDLAVVSDIVTDALTAFGLKAKDTQRFVDVLAKASSSSNTNVSMMGETFKYVAPVAGALGFSVEHTATLIGLMANSGIKASQAGTSLRTIMNKLSKDVKVSGKNIGDVTIETKNADGSMRNLNDIIVDLRKAFSGMTDSEKAANAQTIAGKNAMSGLLAIVNASDEDFAALTKEIENSAGASQEMADIMQDNLQGALTILKSNLESAGIAIGQRLTPYIRALAEKITSLVEWFNNLSDEQLDMIVKIGMLLASLGPALLIFGKVINVVLTMQKAFQGVSTMLGLLKSNIFAMLGGIGTPMLGVIAIVGVLVAAFVTLWKTNEKFRKKMTAIWESLKQKVGGFLDGIVEQINSLGFDFENFAELAKSVWIGLCNFLAPLFEGTFAIITDIIGTVMDTLMGFTKLIVGIISGDKDKIKDGLEQIFSSVVEGLAAVVGDMFGIIGEQIALFLESLGFADAAENVRSFAEKVSGFLKNIGSFFDSVDKKINDFVKGFKKGFTDAINSVKKFFKSIKDFFTKKIPNALKQFVSKTMPDFFKSLLNGFIELPAKIWLYLSSVVEKVRVWASNMLTAARNAGKNIVDSVISFFKNLPYNIGVLLGQVIGEIISFSTKAVSTVKTEVPKIINNIVTFFKDLPKNIATHLSNALKKLTSWASDMANNAKTAGSNFVKAYIEYVKTLPTKIWDHFTSAVTKVKNFGTNAVSAAKTAATNLLNGFVNNVKNLPSKLATYLTSAVNKVVSWASTMLSKAKSAGNNIVNGVKNAVSSLPNQMVTIGKNIVNGVWNGIKSLKTTLTNNVKNFFKGIVDGVKKTLGIHSPSTVFASIGENTMLGFSQGFDDEFKHAKDDVEDSLNELTNVGTDPNKNSLFKSNISDILDSMKSISELFINGLYDMMDNMLDKLKQIADKMYEVGEIAEKIGLVNGYDSFSPSMMLSAQGGNGGTVAGNRNSNVFGGDVYNFYDTIATPYEYARQIRQTKKEMFD